MEEKLIFIGPLEVNQREKTILEVLGQALAYMKIQLIVAPRGAANEAVIHAYKEFKGEPILKPGKLLNEEADAFFVYTDLDHELIRMLDAALPHWRRFSPEPTIVQGPDELQDYVYAMLAAIKQAEMQEGVIDAGPTG